MDMYVSCIGSACKPSASAWNQFDFEMPANRRCAHDIHANIIVHNWAFLPT